MAKIVITLDQPEIFALEKNGDKQQIATVNKYHLYF
jgi:hypothetical protein